MRFLDLPSDLMDCFVMGTDTGIGKTRAACKLIERLVRADRRVAGMKPVASGAFHDGSRWRHGDVEAIMAASNLTLPVDDVCPYLLPEPIAPSFAAARLGVTIDLDVISSAFDRLKKSADCCIVEAAGGVCVPIDDDGQIDMLSIAEKLGIPIVVVVGIRLGAINHARLTVEAIQRRGLNLIGWIANRIEPDDRKDQSEAIALLRKALGSPLIGEMVFDKASTS